ncbi:MAG: hypothetical protein FIB01_02095 [Gemmatimonadetes bacterium]|nr:hypothetical protein [Gemmatimonadota bacterium]
MKVVRALEPDQGLWYRREFWCRPRAHLHLGMRTLLTRALARVPYRQHVNSQLVAPLLALLLFGAGVHPAERPAERRVDTGTRTPHLVADGQAIAQVPEPGGHAQLGYKGDSGSSRALAAPGAHDARAVVSRIRARQRAAHGAECSGSPPLYFASLPPPG